MSANPLDIKCGSPANGLVWGLENFGNNQPPTDSNFCNRDGRQFLRDSTWAAKMRRHKDRPPMWFNIVYGDGVTYTESEDGEHDVFIWTTPVGSVTGRRHHKHFVEHPLKSVEDLKVWTYVYSRMRFEENQAVLAKPAARQPPVIKFRDSPVQQLLQFDMGVENFYYAMADAPEQVMELLAVMQERCIDRLVLGLSLFPQASIVHWDENTSSSMISPTYYRQFTMPHIQAYSRLVHQHNKRLNVHMCGLLSDLLDAIVLTEIDGIDSVTPPPIGDTPYRLVREKFKPDLYILGRLNAQLWVGKSRETIQATIREMVYPELLQTPFILSVTSDANPDIPRDDVMILYEALQTMTW